MKDSLKGLYCGISGFLCFLGVAQCLYPYGGISEMERRFDTYTSTAYDVVALSIIFLGGLFFIAMQFELGFGFSRGLRKRPGQAPETNGSITNTQPQKPTD